MRIELGLLNASFEFPFREGEGKLPVTFDAENTVRSRQTVGYQIFRMTCWRTSAKETKAYPTIHTYLPTALTGDCLRWNDLWSMRNAEHPL